MMKFPAHIQLTRQEVRIVDLMREAAPQKDIAAMLGISIETVKVHVAHIFDKIGRNSTLEVVVFCHELEKEEMLAELSRLRACRCPSENLGLTC